MVGNLQASYVNNRIGYYLNLGGGVFSPIVAVTLSAMTAHAVRAADIDVRIRAALPHHVPSLCVVLAVRCRCWSCRVTVRWISCLRLRTTTRSRGTATLSKTRVGPGECRCSLPDRRSLFPTRPPAPTNWKSRIWMVFRGVLGVSVVDTSEPGVASRLLVHAG